MILKENEIYEKLLKVIAANNNQRLSPTELKVMVGLLMEETVGIEAFLPTRRAKLIQKLGIHNTTYSTTLNKLAEKGFMEETQDRGIYRINEFILHLRKVLRHKGAVEVNFKYEQRKNNTGVLEDS